MADTNGNGAGNGNGRDPLSGMPWQIRAIFIIGVPSAIALWLTYVGTANISQNVRTNGDALAIVRSEAALHDQRVRAQFDELQQSAITQTRILRSICQSVAKNDLQREKCTE